MTSNRHKYCQVNIDLSKALIQKVRNKNQRRLNSNEQKFIISYECISGGKDLCDGSIRRNIILNSEAFNDPAPSGASDLAPSGASDLAPSGASDLAPSGASDSAPSSSGASDLAPSGASEAIDNLAPSGASETSNSNNKFNGQIQYIIIILIIYLL
jgi:hypothetical protein